MGFAGELQFLGLYLKRYQIRVGLFGYDQEL